MYEYWYPGKRPWPKLGPAPAWESYVPIPKGCICPPTAEKTCQSKGCPRKGD